MLEKEFSPSHVAGIACRDEQCYSIAIGLININAMLYQSINNLDVLSLKVYSHKTPVIICLSIAIGLLSDEMPGYGRLAIGS